MPEFLSLSQFFSASTVCAGLIDVQFSGVQCYGSQLGSLCFLDLYLEVVVFTVMETYYRFERFLFPFFLWIRLMSF